MRVEKLAAELFFFLFSSKSYENGDDEIDTRTPYISRIIEAKSPKIIASQYKS